MNILCNCGKMMRIKVEGVKIVWRISTNLKEDIQMYKLVSLLLFGPSKRASLLWFPVDSQEAGKEKERNGQKNDLLAEQTLL